MESNWDKELREAKEALLRWDRPALTPDTLICECYCVSVLDIQQAFAKTRTVNLEKLQQDFKLGTGCGQCLKDKSNWMNLIFCD
jgi:NAD(P)H-nitrite reductase large subunit